MAPAGPSFLLQAELDHRILLSDPKSHSVLTSSSCYWSIKTHARAVIELLTRLSIKHLYIANKRDFPFISLRSWTNTLTTPVLSFFFFFWFGSFYWIIDSVLWFLLGFFWLPPDPGCGFSLWLLIQAHFFISFRDSFPLLNESYPSSKKKGDLAPFH